MRRFLSSAWFPFFIALVMAGVTVAAYAALKPTGEDVTNHQVLQAFKIAAWAVGPVMGLLSLLLMGLLNLIRRMLRLRKVALLHPAVVLVGVLPWFIFGWSLTGEPRYTTFARAAIEFVGRPMLWGALVALLLTIVLSIPLFLSSSKK